MIRDAQLVSNDALNDNKSQLEVEIEREDGIPLEVSHHGVTPFKMDMSSIKDNSLLNGESDQQNSLRKQEPSA